MFNQASKNKQAGAAVRRGGKLKLYSVPVWMEQRAFAGGFDLAGSTYKLVFTIARAEVVNKQLQLRGKLTVTDGRGRARAVEDVRATFAAIQGGIGSAPFRRRVRAAGAETGNMTTSQQKQQATSENEKRAGQKAEEPAQPRLVLPKTESTGPTSFCGIMYLHLEPLNARSLGVAADLSRVQLNARFTPKDQATQTLHSLYSALVDAVYGTDASESEAAAIVEELNKALRG